MSQNDPKPAGFQLSDRWGGRLPAELAASVLAVFSDMVLVFGRGGQVIYANDAARALACAAGALSGEDSSESGFPVHVLDPIEAQCRMVRETGQSITDDVSFSTGDAIREVEYTASPLRGAGGEVEAVVVTGRDITERKQSEHWLVQSQARLRLLNGVLSEAASEPSWEDAIRRTLRQLTAHFEGLRAAYSTLDDRSILRPLHSIGPDSMPSIEGAEIDLSPAPEFVAALRSGEPYVSGDVLADPRARAVSDAFAMSQARGLIMVPVYHSDELDGLLCLSAPVPREWSRHDAAALSEIGDYLSIVARKAAADRMRFQAELALRENEARLSAIWNTAADGIITVDESGSIESFNPAAEAIFARAAAEVVGRPVQELIPDWTGNGPGDQAPPGPAAPFTGNRAGGATFPLDLELSETRVGSRVLKTGFLRDVSDRVQLEAQLRQSQKMEAVGRLAGGVAHDFNNMLMAVTGYADLLLERTRLDDAARGYVDEIRKAADRASRLTGQLLAFSRQQILAPQILDLSDAVTNMETMLRRLIGEDITLIIHSQPGLGRVRADPGQIEQVVLNLAVNARDAMPQGGNLTIETRNVTFEKGYTWGHFPVEPGDYVMISVSDTGCGMDEAIRSRIFEPFYSTKEQGKGTGLGLSTVYGIIKQSGGYVWVYSEPGHGATFKIYLPRQDAPLSPQPAAESTARTAPGSETVLLVEDESMVRALVRDILAMRGYQVLDAPNGTAAVRKAEEHAGPIEILLTDVVMPGISGRELAEQLRHLRPDIRVLYMSGYTDDAIIHHGILDAETAFIQKPFAPEALARKLREVLDRS